MSSNKEKQKIYYDNHFSDKSAFNNYEISENTKYLIKNFINDIIKPQSKKVLEIGCGNGLLTFFLLQNPIQVTAVDISETAIENLKKQFPSEIRQGKLKLECADLIEFLENSDETFDVVVGSGIIHHIEKNNWKKLFQLANDRLNPGGIFACGPEPNAGGLYAIAWPFAKFFYRLFGMDYDWEVEKGTFDMIPKKLTAALKNAGFQNSEILPYKFIPHFHLKFLENIDKKLIKYGKGKISFYIIIKGNKQQKMGFENK